MEQVLDWLNENENRAYPLLEETSKLVVFPAGSGQYLLDDNFLLDLQLISFESLSVVDTLLGPVSASVTLSSVRYNSSGDLLVGFSVESVSITTFTITAAASAAYPYYVRNPDGCLAVFGAGVASLIAGGLPTAQTVSLNIPVEPATCSQFNDAWLGVGGISVSPEKLSVPLSYEPLLPIEDNPSTSKLTGDVKFLEGYNFRVNIADNLIDLEISTRYGLIMNCSTSFLPTRYLDCAELVSYINGVPPDTQGKFTLNEGNNSSITSGNALGAFDDSLDESANAHSLFVGLTFQSTDLCPPVNITPSVI